MDILSKCTTEEPFLKGLCTAALKGQGTTKGGHSIQRQSTGELSPPLGKKVRPGELSESPGCATVQGDI